MLNTSNLKVNLNHDWLNGMRGGEKCLEEMIQLFPDNEIYTLLYQEGKLSDLIQNRPVHTSPLQNFPAVFKYYKHYLPFYQSMSQKIKMRPCDLIISTNHCVAKSFLKPAPDTKHICYCFTPMRYAWLFFDEYFGHFPKPIQMYLRRLTASLRVWDKATSNRVTHFVAISHHIRKRIERFYGREAAVIYPPVNTDFYQQDFGERNDEAVVVSALVPYKRVDLAVKACVQMQKKLVVIGTGPELDNLKALGGEYVEFLGWGTDEEIKKRYNRSKYLLFPGEEDFGIVPVEAQACGMPVIALGRGGALETIQSGKTGVFFEEQSVDSMIKAIQIADNINWDAKAIRKHAEGFSQQRFKQEFAQYVNQVFATQTN
ncbi:MAG: glycosyltransferase involved in cell wall biosynthesis [Candidatus Omnitrophota bacterium]|jgi:glycosyltransferase involved in cell wall biosynthesis